MKKILVFVSTLDGKITKWGDPYVRSWTSRADQAYFTKLLKESKLVIIGSKTFIADPLKPVPGRLLVIMTNHPSDYSKYAVDGQIEISDESPSRLVARFEKEGYQEMTVVGGPAIASSFLKEKQIDELWLTIEPKIFGRGGNFVTETKLDIILQLMSCEKVNDQGTLITRYSVISNNSV